MTCGSGQYTRHVTCTGDQGIVPDTDCDPEKKPPITTSCDLKTCPYWFAGEWTRVSERFGIVLPRVFYKKGNTRALRVLVLFIIVVGNV